jgi:hypothetical protein
MLNNAMPAETQSRPRFRSPKLQYSSSFPGKAPAAHRQPPAINPDFALTCSGYHVRFTQGIAYLQSKVSLLVENMYGARGLQLQSGAQQPQRAGQTTLAACSGDHVFGTLTLGIDAPSGLLADTLYRDEIDEVREKGGRVCEVTRLAVDSEFRSPDVLAAIFNVAFILARNIHGMTDLFAEVHPRHSGFYRRMLGYEVAGPQRTCPRVGAPAVLMQLRLDYAEEQIRKLGGNPEGAGLSLYRLCPSQSEQNRLVQQLVTPKSLAA